MQRLAILVICLSLPAVSFAAWEPPAGVDLTRPRILFAPGAVPLLQARLEREPYRSFARAMMQRIRQADGAALDDDSIDAHRLKSRAAKNLAFFYAVDRTVIDGEVVPFASAGDREAAGERVRDLLTHLFPRSRLAVEPPVGGWDRDISTSEELLQYATAYDTMLGAGYDFGDADAIISGRLADLASELYENYVRPETAGFFAVLHNNNHRSKSGAALAVAALALAEYTPEPQSDLRNIREPTLWLDYGLDMVDLIMRYVLVTGDGAYAEGPFYLRFAAQNLFPFARAWDRLIGGGSYAASTRGLQVPSLWSHPLFRRGQRWALDMTLPDGSLAPIDDGNPGRSYYFGLAPHGADLAAAFAWRWANAPAPYDTEGNVDLAADAIVTFDDTVVPAPPAGSPTAFYVEGGNAVFRSDWSTDAVVAMVQAEHDTASEFGRDRDGRGVGPQSHEHAEPGAFLLHAFGERLALDPGYFSFGERTQVNKPEDHNLILVDGMGPVDYLEGSSRWLRRTGRPPVDGNAMLARTVDTGFLDAATVVSRYGQPGESAAEIERRFLFVDNRYLVIADDVIGPGDPLRTYTWLLHGNGGESSGGTFERTALGGRWTQGNARLDSGLVFDVGAPQFEVAVGAHETAAREKRQHNVLRASVQAERVRSLQIVYPSRAARLEPVIRETGDDRSAAMLLLDGVDDRLVVAVRARTPGRGIDLGSASWGGASITTDGDFLLADQEALFGGGFRPLRLVWAEGASTLSVNGVETIATRGRGEIGFRLMADRAEIVAATGDDSVAVRMPFAPVAVDGACDLRTEGEAVIVRLGRERRFVLRAAPGNAVPAADPGADRVVDVGDMVTLDGSASCDADGDALRPSWELVSAPAGSAWRLDAADEWRPRLFVDVRGPYRVRLTVADPAGARSRPVEALIIGGSIDLDGLDNDLDGLFDSDDPDGDAGLVCAGDCTGEGAVTVDEIVRAVDIALGERGLDACRRVDMDGDGRVTVEEIVGALSAALNGCLHDVVL